MALRVSVIATVLNERDSVDALITSLLRQSRVPDEIVIVDGGSIDDTARIIERRIAEGAPIKLIVEPGANISRGRNIAVENARGEIIASTDSGVRLSLDWLRDLLAGFGPHVIDQQTGTPPLAADVVCGFFVADPRTPFERAMGATVLPGVDEINGARFLPSSRSVAFTRDVWREVGGYPEWLDYCEDLVFDLNLRAKGYRFVFVPSALVHFRPRQNLRQYFKQYYQYARGDGKADLWRRRHAIRYGTYLLAPIALALGFWYKVSWLLLVIACLVYLQRPYRRLWSLARPPGRAGQLEAVLWVPVIRLVGDVAKMVGYPVGVWWRWRNRR